MSRPEASRRSRSISARHRAFLQGRPISAETARAAADEAVGEIAPISDVRGSADYKRALLPRLIMAHFLTLFPEPIREEDLA